jgi:hypothetical protein
VRVGEREKRTRVKREMGIGRDSRERARDGKRGAGEESCGLAGRGLEGEGGER